jgi:Tfp pilus assembly PilM family ATPase
MKWPIRRRVRVIESIGLDISNTAIRLVTLRKTAEKIEIQQFYHLPVEKNESDEWEYAVLKSLKYAMTQLHTACREVIIAIPDVLGFTQKITIEINKNRYWRHAAVVAMAPTLPEPLDTLYFDFEKTPMKNEANQLTVTGFFCFRSTVEKKATLVKTAGLYPTIVEIESHALERLCQYLYELHHYPNCWAWVYLGEHTFTILLWEKDLLIATMSDYLHPLSIMDSLITQLHSSIMCLISLHSTHTLEAIWVVGSYPNCHTVQTQVQRAFHLAQQPLPILKKHVSIYTAENYSPFYLALGLALRGR